VGVFTAQAVEQWSVHH